MLRHFVLIFLSLSVDSFLAYSCGYFFTIFLKKLPHKELKFEIKDKKLLLFKVIKILRQIIYLFIFAICFDN